MKFRQDGWCKLQSVSYDKKNHLRYYALNTIDTTEITVEVYSKIVKHIFIRRYFAPGSTSIKEIETLPIKDKKIKIRPISTVEDLIQLINKIYLLC